jgi:hypothetical protein
VGAKQGLAANVERHARQDVQKMRPSLEIMGSYNKKRDSLVSQLVELYLPPTSLDTPSSNSAVAAASQPRQLPAASSYAHGVAPHAIVNSLQGAPVQVPDLQVDGERGRSSMYGFSRDSVGDSGANARARDRSAVQGRIWRACALCVPASVVIRVYVCVFV